MVTNDIVGRPTEIRFFYKQEEKENFVVYFPNFNLTMRDPGNFGELAMITLPKYVQARFVILGMFNILLLYNNLIGIRCRYIKYINSMNNFRNR